MNKGDTLQCVYILVSHRINHRVFMRGIRFVHRSVKNGLGESKLSGWFAGQLHKQLACLRI